MKLERERERERESRIPLKTFEIFFTATIILAYVSEREKERKREKVNVR